MTTVIAVDPGCLQSALVSWDGSRIKRAEILLNHEILDIVRHNSDTEAQLAIEMVACYGMPVGREVFDTVLWIGQFMEAWNWNAVGESTRLIYRRDIKMHHCGNMHAKDANVAQALRDKYGEKGTKKNPGVTYALKSHLWQAFALATYVTETTQPQPERTICSAIKPEN